MNCGKSVKNLMIGKTSLNRNKPVSLKQGEVAPFDCKCIDAEDVKLLLNEATR